MLLPTCWKMLHINFFSINNYTDAFTWYSKFFLHEILLVAMQ